MMNLTLMTADWYIKKMIFYQILKRITCSVLYICEAAQHPLLTIEEEVDWAKRIALGLLAREEMSNIKSSHGWSWDSHPGGNIGVNWRHSSKEGRMNRVALRLHQIASEVQPHKEGKVALHKKFFCWMRLTKNFNSVTVVATSCKRSSICIPHNYWRKLSMEVLSHENATFLLSFTQF